MSTVTQILNWISNSLLLPVIVLLLAELIASLISLGGFCTTYLTLLQERRKRNELLKKIKAGEELKAADLLDQGIFAEQIAELQELNWKTKPAIRSRLPLLSAQVSHPCEKPP